MIKINILRSNEEAKTLIDIHWRYWNLIFHFKKEFDELKIKFKFYFFKSIHDPKFYDCDYIFLDSRAFPRIKTYKDDIIDANYTVDLSLLKKISLKNNNLIWFDTRDSAGTSQFEVMPYVKKYVKKQLYKDMNLYQKDLYGGRYYTDFYNKKFQIVDNRPYIQEFLLDKYKKKLILGWNIGAGRFYNYLEFGYLDYQIERLKIFLKIKNLNTKKILPFFKYNDSSKNDFFVHLKIHNEVAHSRNTVIFQRTELVKNLKNDFPNYKFDNNKITLKDYYKKLIDSKICFSAYGWGEVCYRDFEAIYCGVPFLTADMSNIITWPNVYQDNVTYISYDLDFKNLKDKIEYILNNDRKRKELVSNSQEVLRNVYKDEGKKYFVNKILEIIA